MGEINKKIIIKNLYQFRLIYQFYKKKMKKNNIKIDSQQIKYSRIKLKKSI